MEQIVKAVLAIVRQRGFEASKVYSLITGLWIDVKLTNGHTLTIQDWQIQEAL